MYFLLVNNNPAVSRLIILSVEKLGFKIDELSSFDELTRESYDIVFVNNEQYNEEIINQQKEEGLSRHFVYIGARGVLKPQNMDSMIEKPFLPTDFIDLVTKINTEKNDDKREIEELIGADLELPEIEEDDEIIADTEDSLVSPYSDWNLDELGDEDDDTLGLDEEILNESEKENSEQDADNEYLTPVLDRYDIDEVKQLLEDNSTDDTAQNNLENTDDEEIALLSDVPIKDETLSSHDTLDFDEDNLEDFGVFDEDFKEDENSDIVDLEKEFEDFSTETNDIDFGDFDDENEELQGEPAKIMEESSREDDLKEEEFTFEDLSEEVDEENTPNQEETNERVDDLSDDDEELEGIPEKIMEESSREDDLKEEEFTFEDLSDKVEEKNDEEEEFTFQDDVKLEIDTEDIEELSSPNLEQEGRIETNQKNEQRSIDDLNENDFLNAFEADAAKEDDSQEIQQEVYADNLEEEIKLAVGKSVKEALSNSSLRDSLKGMRVNISITFDEGQ